MATTIAVVAAGAMGAAVGKRLVQHGCRVLTVLEGRSPSTRERAKAAGMEDASLSEIGAQARWVLSILPPRDAVSFATAFLSACGKEHNQGLAFVDCNAVNPDTVHRIGELFARPGIPFIDGAIIGGPPTDDGYNPTFYASSDDKDALERFDGLSKLGLKISTMKGESGGVGDASALKMSYAVSLWRCLRRPFISLC